MQERKQSGIKDVLERMSGGSGEGECVCELCQTSAEQRVKWEDQEEVERGVRHCALSVDPRLMREASIKNMDHMKYIFSIGLELVLKALEHQSDA